MNWVLPGRKIVATREFPTYYKVVKTRPLKVSEFVIPLRIRKLKGGGYLATSTVLRGLVAQGRSLAETMEIAQDVARKLIESYLDHGDPLPASLKRVIKKGYTASIQVPVAVNF